LSNREALPRFLIVDGYTREARDQLQAGGASVAADLYQKMLSDCAPFQIECDILFPCDDPAALPMGEELAGYCAIAWTGCSLSLAEESPVDRGGLAEYDPCKNNSLTAYTSESNLHSPYPLNTIL